jgi:hypothetical protein
MSQIVNQHKAQEEREARAARRHELISRLKKAAIFCGGAALLAVAYVHREDLQSLASNLWKHDGNASKPEGLAAGNLQKAADNAALRDQLINDMSKAGNATN